MKIKVKKLDSNAKVPVRANATDAGADLYSVENTSIPPLSRKLISTGISVEIPEGYYGRVAPRSGLAFKNGIDVLAGVIDSSYRGSVGVILFNTDTDKAFEVKIGDRIAQLIVEAHYNMAFQEYDELSNSDRGSGGFGSTGV
jgi:dUTP pyrophosphatase